MVQLIQIMIPNINKKAERVLFLLHLRRKGMLLIYSVSASLSILRQELKRTRPERELLNNSVGLNRLRNRRIRFGILA